MYSGFGRQSIRHGRRGSLTLSMARALLNYTLREVQPFFANDMHHLSALGHLAIADGVWGPPSIAPRLRFNGLKVE